MMTIEKCVENIKEIMNKAERAEELNGDTLTEINELVDMILSINQQKNEGFVIAEIKRTNADKIREMSNENLAEWITNICDFEKEEEPYKSIYNLETEKEEEIHDSYGDLLIWLQSEAV